MPSSRRPGSPSRMPRRPCPSSGCYTLLPEISIDLEPLQHQAKLLEEHLTKLKQQARSVVPPEPIPSEMYR